MSENESLKKMRHASRNWVHHLLLAMQAVDADTLGRLFAKQHPLEVIGLDEKQSWHDWHDWQQYLKEFLSPLRIGLVKYHLLQSPSIKIEFSEVHLHWQMTFWLLTLQKIPLLLDCQAILVQEDGRWVARRLHYSQLSSP